MTTSTAGSTAGSTATKADLPAAALEQAVDHLAAGGFIAYPTETVWGLGACADQPEAVRRLIDWKGRGANAPLAVLVRGVSDFEAIGCTRSDVVDRLTEQFWPGPLMLILPCRRKWAPGVAGEGGALGVRCSPDPIAETLVDRLAARGLGPLTSTSFNRSGSPPATNWAEAQALSGPGSDRHSEAPDPSDPLLLGGASWDAGGAVPSTVVDCTREAISVLREGAIETSAIEAIVGTSIR